MGVPDRLRRVAPFECADELQNCDNHPKKPRASICRMTTAGWFGRFAIPPGVFR